MGNHDDPIREGIDNFVGPVKQMFRNIGMNISDTISDLGDAVSKSETCKLNNLDLFVKMPKPLLRTAFGHV